MSDVETLDHPSAHQEVSDNGLAVVSLAKAYDKRQVLSDVSLSVQRGEVVGLLGPNGAGKTTCFYSVMGLVRSEEHTFELQSLMRISYAVSFFQIQKNILLR